MAYLMTHFIGEQKDGEQVYFAVSADGLHWQDLSSEPVLHSTLGEQGVRDPFMIKCPKTGIYYLIATDLRIEAGKGWHVAQFEGSRDLIIWQSTDLVNWSEPWAVTVATSDAGCAWAPESIYDVEKQAFFVFWASMVQLEKDEKPKQRMYGSYTKGFREFSTPFVYAEADNHLIDMNIVRENGWYYRFVKDETTKLVRMDKLQNLNDKPILVTIPDLNHLIVEGPQTYQLPDGRWCLIVDQFAAGLGYLPLVCTTLEQADFKILLEGDYDFGKLMKRHGGVIEITDEEMERIIEKFGAKKIIKKGVLGT